MPITAGRIDNIPGRVWAVTAATLERATRASVKRMVVQVGCAVGGGCIDSDRGRVNTGGDR
jgi:hypothetical protein